MNDDERTLEDGVSVTEHNALLSIVHGAVVTSGGVSIQRGLSVWIDVLLTRGLGPELYGIYALGWRLTTMLLRFANLGANTTLLRDVPAFADEPDRQRRILGLAYATTAITASALAGMIFLAAGWINDATIGHPAFPPALRLFAVLLALLAFVRMHASSLKAAKSANGEVILNRVLRPGARLIAAAAATAVGYSVVGVVGTLVITVAIVAVVGYPVTIATTGIRPTFRDLRLEALHFYDHAIPSALSGIGGLLRTRIDVLLIGALLTATVAGIYNVVLLLVGIATIPLLAFNQLMPPVASELYSDGDIRTLNDVYTTVTRLVVTATLPIIAIQAVFGRELLSLFGPAYGRGYTVLLVFLVGRIIGNAVGATGILLSMTNNQYLKMGLEWVLALLNVVLTYLFVLAFGLIGAALGTSVAIAVQNLLQVTLLLRFEGLWPFDATFLKPLGAGLGMLGVMAGVRTVLNGALAIGVGTLAGLAAFVALLLSLGVNPRDRFIVRELTSRYYCVASAKIAAIR